MISRFVVAKKGGKGKVKLLSRIPAFLKAWMNRRGKKLTKSFFHSNKNILASYLSIEKKEEFDFLTQ